MYGNCKVSIFFDKKFLFFIKHDTPNFMPKQKKVLRKFDGTTFAKCMKLL